MLRVYLGEIEGKRKYSSKVYEGTISQAKAELTRMLKEVDSDEYIAPTGQTVKEYVEHWLTANASARVSVRTLTMYRYMMTRYVYPELGHRKLDTLHNQHVQALVAAMQGRKLGPRIIQYTHTVLKAALTQAVKWRQLRFNPAEDITLPELVKKEPQVLLPEHVVKLLRATTDTPLGALWCVMLHSGMRPQEAGALTWDDLDVAAGTVSVNKALVEETSGHWIIGPTKTRKGRVVALPPECVAQLQAHRVRQAATILQAGAAYDRAGNLMFATKHGKSLCLHNVYRAWRRTLKALGLPEVKLYACRHTHISLSLSGGANVKDVAGRVGHASAKMTLDVYAASLPGASAAVAGVFSNILRKVAI